MNLALFLIAIPLVGLLYAYVGYPLILLLLAALRRETASRHSEWTWPSISVCIPVYNEEASIGAKLTQLVASDYPANRQVLVISDASTDGTDEIVRGFADRGVELLRQPERRGKTAAENAATALITGDIVVNTDATIIIPPPSLKALVRAFADPTVGVASGRDISVGADGTEANRGESGYVSYEMSVRSLETRVGSIVGASGCFFAIRRDLHRIPVPPQLSRDFASALIARENGYRSVSVNDAVCLVPRTGSLSIEFRRKVRTMARGLDTLRHWRHLLNPLRHGGFAWMLFSHKLCRWLVPVFFPVALAGLGILSFYWPPATVAFGSVILAAALGWLALRWPEGKRLPRPVAWCGYLLSANLAAILAWSQVLRGDTNPIWEPTRR